MVAVIVAALFAAVLAICLWPGADNAPTVKPEPSRAYSAAEVQTRLALLQAQEQQDRQAFGPWHD